MFWVLMYFQRNEKRVISGSSPISNIRAYSLGLDFFRSKLIYI